MTRDVLVGDRASIGVRSAQGGELAAHVADADAEGQAPAAELVGTGQQLGEDDGIAVGGDQHVAAEADAAGGARPDQHAAQRVEPVGRHQSGGVAGHDDVVAEP